MHLVSARDRQAESSPRQPAEALHAGSRLDALDLRIAIAIFVAALALRAVYLSEIVSLPEFDMPAVDAGYHDYWAWGLVSGDWTPPANQKDPQIESTPYFRPPLCPYFLSIVYGAFGRSYVAVRIVQMVIGAASCVLLYVLARRLFDRATAVVAGCVMAGYWVFIYFDAELREVVLLVFVHLLAIQSLLALRRRPTVLAAVGCGVLLGLAALGKPNNLLFVPVAIGWLAAVFKGLLPRRRSVLVNFGLLAGAAATVAPATIRNVVVGDDLVLISSNGGINLYIGNNPLATGHDVRLPRPIPEFANAFDYPAIVRHVESVEGRPLKHSEVSRYFAGLALEDVRATPGRCLGLMLRKALLFWGGMEIVSEQDLNAARAESRLLRYLPGNFAVLLACAVIGLFLALRPRPPDADRSGSVAQSDRADVVIILLFVGVYFVSFLPFFVTARYRVPITPLVILFGSYGLVQVAAAVRGRQLLRALVAVAAAVLLWLLGSADWFHVSDDGFKARYDRAVNYQKQGRAEEAVEAYREALAIRPHAPRAHNNLGILLSDLQRPQEAVRHYTEALRVMPDYAEAHNNLGIELLLGFGDIEGSLRHCAEAVRLRPDFAPGHKSLGLALAKAGQTGPAIERYLRYLELMPGDAGVYQNLGVLYARVERMDECVAAFRQSLRLNPDNAKVRQLLEAATTEQSADAPP